MQKISIFVRIDPDLKSWLEEQARKDRRSLSAYVRLAIENHREKEMEK